MVLKKEKKTREVRIAANSDVDWVGAELVTEFEMHTRPIMMTKSGYLFKVLSSVNVCNYYKK